MVATPIGNLGDVSARARDVFSGCSVIAAEDTRRTGQLLSHLGIHCPMVSLYSHNERRRTDELVARLRAGESVALVSDAGTPLVSDPGGTLVAAAVEAGIVIVPVPGPSAVMAALSGAGFPVDRFVFDGFLPRQAGARAERMASWRGETRAVVWFESPRRVRESLTALVAAGLGERRLTVGRELTKLYEEFVRGTVKSLAADESTMARLERGELVLVMEGAAVAPTPGIEGIEPLMRAMLRGLSPAQVAKALAEATGQDRKTLYRQACDLSGAAADE